MAPAGKHPFMEVETLLQAQFDMGIESSNRMSWTLLGYAKHYSITLPHWEFEKRISSIWLIEQELCFSLANPTTQHHPTQQLNSFLSVKKKAFHICVCVRERGSVLVRWGSSHRREIWFWFIYSCFFQKQMCDFDAHTVQLLMYGNIKCNKMASDFSLGHFTH